MQLRIEMERVQGSDHHKDKTGDDVGRAEGGGSAGLV